MKVLVGLFYLGLALVNLAVVGCSIYLVVQFAAKYW